MKWMILGILAMIPSLATANSLQEITSDACGGIQNSSYSGSCKLFVSNYLAKTPLQPGSDDYGVGLYEVQLVRAACTQSFANSAADSAESTVQCLEGSRLISVIPGTKKEYIVVDNISPENAANAEIAPVHKKYDPKQIESAELGMFNKMASNLSVLEQPTPGLNRYYPGGAHQLAALNSLNQAPQTPPQTEVTNSPAKSSFGQTEEYTSSDIESQPAAAAAR